MNVDQECMGVWMSNTNCPTCLAFQHLMTHSYYALKHRLSTQHILKAIINFCALLLSTQKKTLTRNYQCPLIVTHMRTQAWYQGWQKATTSIITCSWCSTTSFRGIFRVWNDGIWIWFMKRNCKSRRDLSNFCLFASIFFKSKDIIVWSEPVQSISKMPTL